MEKFDFDMLLQRQKKGSTKTQTLGVITVFEDNIKPIYDCKSMELELDCNAVRDDCIPAGIYSVIKHNSPKFGPCFWIQDVPDRSEILMHPANFHYQLLGCIAPGTKHFDIDKDGDLDVTNSRNTIKKLLSLMPDRFNLLIVDPVNEDFYQKQIDGNVKKLKEKAKKAKAKK